MKLREKIKTLFAHPYMAPLADIVRLPLEVKDKLRKLASEPYEDYWQRAQSPNNFQKGWLKKMPPAIRFVAEIFRNPIKKKRGQGVLHIFGGVVGLISSIGILESIAAVPVAVALTCVPLVTIAGFALGPPIVATLLGAGFALAGFGQGCINAVRHKMGKPPLFPKNSGMSAAPSRPEPADADVVCKNTIDSLYNLDAEGRQKILVTLRREFNGDYSDIAAKATKNTGVTESVMPVPKIRLKAKR